MNCTHVHEYFTRRIIFRCLCARPAFKVVWFINRLRPFQREDVADNLSYGMLLSSAFVVLLKYEEHFCTLLFISSFAVAFYAIVLVNLLWAQAQLDVILYRVWEMPMKIPVFLSCNIYVRHMYSIIFHNYGMKIWIEQDIYFRRSLFCWKHGLSPKIITIIMWQKFELNKKFILERRPFLLEAWTSFLKNHYLSSFSELTLRSTLTTECS